MKDMPTGFPTIRRKENNFKAEKRHWYGQLAREWLEYEAAKRGIFIEHMFNVGDRKMGEKKIPVDGYHPESKTVFQFHGCMWHGHRCYVTRGMDENPLNGKPFDELDEKTGEITKYLREELKVNVVEMRECSWNNKKKRNMKS
ncbi:novel protein similar to DNA polymerases [Elysia marginata]|uniref:Novel protein similar to DNA polymerases n=1 Tax=Elysia marginata TaxID=1093978 RepID=A0AAV4GUC4_9GAST|nr:novel protein similar to DNA polymerases [Elysia marginata]